MLCVRRWSDAGPAGRVRCWLVLVNCQEPKTGKQKVQLYNKDDPLCPSSYIIIHVIGVHCYSGLETCSLVCCGISPHICWLNQTQDVFLFYTITSWVEERFLTENLVCWPPCLIISTGVRTTVCTDNLPSPGLELATHQRPWQNYTATCANRACLPPGQTSLGEFTRPGSSQCVSVIGLSADANPHIGQG